jgi:hypothetical protein
MNRAAKCINKFFIRRFFKAVYLLPVVLCVLLTCPLSSHPVLGGGIPEGQSMLKKVSKSGPAAWKPPKAIKSSPPPSVSTIDPRTLKVPTFGKRTSTDSLHSEPGEAGNCGVQPNITNDTFITAVFPQLPGGAFPAVCSISGDPTERGWPASRADSSTKLPAGKNNYLSCSSFFPCLDGTFHARKAQLAAYHFMMLDDLGTKVPMERLGDFKLSWLIETSPGNYQGGIILEAPMTDGDEAEQLLEALISSGLSDKGASSLARWARLPVAINGKSKYLVGGRPFCCRLVEWRPDKRYSPQ